MIRFFVHGIAEGQGRLTSFKARHSDKIVTKHSNADKLKPWRSLVAGVAQLHASMSTAPIALELVFFMPRTKSMRKTRWNPKVTRPDLDHLVRAVLDALTGVVYVDDAQVQHIRASKLYARDGGPIGVLVAVREWTEEQEEELHGNAQEQRERTAAPQAQAQRAEAR